MVYKKHKFALLIKLLYFNLGKIHIMEFKLLKKVCLSCVTTQAKDLKPSLTTNDLHLCDAVVFALLCQGDLRDRH